MSRTSKFSTDRFTRILIVVHSILADSTFLYRCYVVWGGDLKIIALPALLLIASMVCGYLFEGSSSILFAYSWVYVLLTFVLNVILTFLTGELFNYYVQDMLLESFHSWSGMVAFIERPEAIGQGLSKALPCRNGCDVSAVPP
jgi:hypothetical protein